MSKELLVNECRRSGALEQQNRDLMINKEKLEREILELKRLLAGQEEKYRRRVTNLVSFFNDKPYPSRRQILEYIDVELVD